MLSADPLTQNDSVGTYDTDSRVLILEQRLQSLKVSPKNLYLQDILLVLSSQPAPSIPTVIFLSGVLLNTKQCSNLPPECL